MQLMWNTSLQRNDILRPTQCFYGRIVFTRRRARLLLPEASLRLVIIQIIFRFFINLKLIVFQKWKISSLIAICKNFWKIVAFSSLRIKRKKNRFRFEKTENKLKNSHSLRFRNRKQGEYWSPDLTITKDLFYNCYSNSVIIQYQNWSKINLFWHSHYNFPDCSLGLPNKLIWRIALKIQSQDLIF